MARFGWGFILICTLFLFVFDAFAGMYYVSLNGSDANDGLSQQAAFRTIKKGVSSLQAGDTLLIRSGDYGNERAEVQASGTSDAPITVKAEEPGKVMLIGDGSGSGISIINKHHILVEGIKFTNYAAGLLIKYASSYITVRKCIFYNNLNYGLLLYGNIKSPQDSHGHLFTLNQFHDYADSGPGSPLFSSGISDYGIALYFSTNVKVINNYFYGHHHQALSFKKLMFESVAADNVFEGAYYTGIYLGQNEDSAEEGILRSHNLVAEGNAFRPTPQYRLKSPIWVANVTGAIVRNNFMDAPNGYSGQGIGVDGSAREVRIYGNVIIDTAKSRDNPGIRIYADCEIYNNTVANCYSALEFGGKVRVICKNNIFYHNTRPINILSGGDYSGSVFERNNWFPDWSGKGATDISSDPMFVGPTEPLPFNPYNPGVGGRGDLSGNPPPGPDFKILPPEPKFVPDLKRREGYRLSQNSPCIDKGIDVGLPFVGVALDLGALEFSEAASPDFDGNGEVDFEDFFLFARAFGQRATGDNVRFDLDRSGEVDLDDFFLFASAFGAKAPKKVSSSTS